MRVLLLGRWQPLHGGHRALIDHELDAGNEVIIGIRDTALGPENPHTVLERAAMVRAVYGSDVEVCAVPDFDEIVYGRTVGYTFREVGLPVSIQAISGTETRKQKRGRIIWLTGNSGAGKTTLARALAPYLGAVILDGNEMRASISLGAGFSLEDRMEHNLRVARLALVLSNQGRNIIVAVIAPTREIRGAVDAQIIRTALNDASLIFVVYVKRDLPSNPEQPYEPPIYFHCEVCPDEQTVEQEVDAVLKALNIR